MTEQLEQAEAPRLTPSDDEKLRAFSLIEAVAGLGWSLSSLYFSFNDDAYKCQFRRFVKQARATRRQRTETVTGYGDTFAKAIIRCAENATEEDDDGA